MAVESPVDDTTRPMATASEDFDLFADDETVSPFGEGLNHLERQGRLLLTRLKHPHSSPPDPLPGRLHPGETHQREV
jgi:hypothetical protein